MNLLFICASRQVISERPIREISISADTDNRSNLPILSADISAENDAKIGEIFALKSYLTIYVAKN